MRKKKKQKRHFLKVYDLLKEVYLGQSKIFLHEIMYDLNITRMEAYGLCHKAKMMLAGEDIPLRNMWGQSSGGRKMLLGYEWSNETAEDKAKNEGEVVRETKQVRGRFKNYLIRTTAKVINKSLPSERKEIHKRLIGEQAEKMLDILDETAGMLPEPKREEEKTAEDKAKREDE